MLILIIAFFLKVCELHYVLDFAEEVSTTQGTAQQMSMNLFSQKRALNTNLICKTSSVTLGVTTGCSPFKMK